MIRSVTTKKQRNFIKISQLLGESAGIVNDRFRREKGRLAFTHDAVKNWFNQFKSGRIDTEYNLDGDHNFDQITIKE